MVTFNTDLSGGTFTNKDLNPRSVVREGETGYTGNITSAPSGNAGSTNSLKLNYGFLKSLDPSSAVREGEGYFKNINNISPIDVKLADLNANADQALGNMSEYENDFMKFWSASGGDYNTAKRMADQSQDIRNNKSMFQSLDLNQSPVPANESPTYGFSQAMGEMSPMNKLIKAIFGVDQLTGSFEEGKDNDNDQQMASAMAMMGAGQQPTPMPNPILTPTAPQPSPNPEGLYIRPNMLNQVPDSYSQAFKDANNAYMKNVAVRPSDFNEKMDLRGFEQLKGLLGE